jgi:hypothetical protein
VLRVNYRQESKKESFPKIVDGVALSKIRIPKSNGTPIGNLVSVRCKNKWCEKTLF